MWKGRSSTSCAAPPTHGAIRRFVLASSFSRCTGGETDRTASRCFPRGTSPRSSACPGTASTGSSGSSARRSTLAPVTVILGLNAYHGDAAAALVIDGELVAAAEEERFNRVKHCAGFPSLSAAWCLADADIGPDELDHVAVSRDPKANLTAKFRRTLLHGVRPGYL